MYDPSNILYQPYSFPNITLPGRLVRSATELFQSEEDGRVSQLEIDCYRTLARQPLGMVIRGEGKNAEELIEELQKFLAK